MCIDYLIKILSNEFFWWRMSWFCCVCWLSKIKSNPLLTNSWDFSKICWSINRWSKIYLKVSRKDDHSLWGMNRESHCLWDRVIYSKEFNRKYSKFQDLNIWINEFIFQIFKIFFVQTSLDHSESKWRSIDCWII